MIKKEVSIFLIVGGVTVFLDFLTYHILLSSALLNIDICKAIGFLTGTVFAYYANKMWTFSHRNPASGSSIRFVVVYSATLCANIFVNSLIINIGKGSFVIFQIAFFCATLTSATLNFVGMKLFAFREKEVL